MRVTTYVDDDGVERRSDSHRKVRSDRGTVKRHPSHCLHCEMVREYVIYREAEIEAQGGWRNERPTVRYGLIAWQTMWYSNYRLVHPDITSDEPSVVDSHTKLSPLSGLESVPTTFSRAVWWSESPVNR